MVKKIGELLSVFFDEDTIKKARGYNDFFSSWKDIAGENIAAHSRITELERSVLRIEADHPGWIQILQIRQKGLLNKVRRKFPALNITGISFRLSRNPAAAARPERSVEPDTVPETEDAETVPEVTAENLQGLYARIKDDELRESFRRIAEKCGYDMKE
jgi:hypothetical protein